MAIRVALLTALIIMALGIAYFKQDAAWLEEVYAQRYFPLLSGAQRRVSSLLPFSAGDLLYAFAGLYFLRQLWLFIRGWRHPHQKSSLRWQPLLNVLILGLFFWVYFYAFWGLNYYRQGIAHQLGLVKDTITKQELTVLADVLARKAASTKQICLRRGDTAMSYDRLLYSARQAYRDVEHKFPFLRYRVLSMKPSLYGRIGNYVGFLGYYNPFSGEAQINVKGPAMVLPFVACHEMAHQLGYASESEANFVAFLVGAKAKDTLLQYATYLEMFMYAAGNLRLVDTAAANRLLQQVHPAVLNDIRTYRAFYRRHRIFLTAWVDRFYDWYLRAHRQTQGLGSYSDVIGWLVAYQRKYALP